MRRGSSGSAGRLEAAVPGDGQADAGPVDVLTLLGDRFEQMVAQQAEQRHGDPAGVGGLGGEAHVFQAERGSEAGGTVALFDQQLAVVLHDGRPEDRAGKNLQQLCLGDTAFLGKRHGFGERFDGGKNHEVATQLHEIC